MMGSDGEMFNDDNKFFEFLKKEIKNMPTNEVNRKLQLSGFIPFLCGRPEIVDSLTGETIERCKTIGNEDFTNLKIAVGELELNYSRIGQVVDGVTMSKDLAWSIFFQNI